LIAAAVADQGSRVPQSSVRAEIAEILGRQGRQTFFSDRALRTTCPTPPLSISLPCKTRLAPSRRAAPLLDRGSFAQLGVTRSCAPHTFLILAPHVSRHVDRDAHSCSSCHECPFSQMTRPLLHSMLRGAFLSQLRLAARRTPVNREPTGMCRAPLPFAGRSQRGGGLKGAETRRPWYFPPGKKLREGES
jgi:hypothetical protein